MEAAERPIEPDRPNEHVSIGASGDTEHAQNRDAQPQDVDTCRICRGEGSPEEPLFYPCKCSGSIKFVHQDCLMEWLSHSQKKYCELCKTPFHFTKLYSPNMPKKLPTSVFLEKAILHLLSHLWTWLRGLLVGCVWLVCVPWIMRCMWRIMFWIGDAGWARDMHYMSPVINASDNTVMIVDESVPGVATSNATPPMPSVLNITSSTLNLSQDPLVFKLMKGLFTTMVTPLRRSDPLSLHPNMTINPMIARMLEQGQSSILSDIEVLKNLTPSTQVNRFVMDVFEGQIITLSVVIVCILVFLIREWVVQQQPVVDLAAAEADNALAQAGGGVQLENENVAEPDIEDGNVGDEQDQPMQEEQDAEANQQTQPGELRRPHASDVGDMKRYEESLKELKDGLDNLTKAREMLETVEATIPGGFESLDGERQEQMQGLKDKTSQMERDFIQTLYDQQLSLNDLAGAVEHTNENLGLLKEMSERLKAGNKLLPDEVDAFDSSLRPPSMPARGSSSITSTISRDFGEHAQDEALQSQEQDKDSNGSWQHVSYPGQSLHVPPNVTATDEAVVNTTHEPELQADAQTRDDVSWISTATSVEEQTSSNHVGEENPAAMDESIPNEDEQEPQEQGIINKIVEWLWGDIESARVPDPAAADLVGADREEIVHDLAAEPPFVPFEHAQPVDRVVNHEAQIDVDEENDEGQDILLEPAANPPLQIPAPQPGPDGIPLNAADAEAIEDAEDLEGILELIGMQGPIAGLIQNAIFSSILVSLSVALCVLVPYVWGKLVLLHIAEPSLLFKVPLKTATVIADLAIDVTLSSSGYLVWIGLQSYRIMMQIFKIDVSDRRIYRFMLDMHKYAEGAASRLFNSVAATHQFEAGDFLYLSMACHTALYVVEEWVMGEMSFMLDSFKHALQLIATADLPLLGRQAGQLLLQISGLIASATSSVCSVVRSFYTTGSIPIPAGSPLVVPDDPMLTYWDARDRALAVCAGYLAVGILCGLYAKIAPVTSSARGRRIESYIVEGCLQAGGVLKVILIISIEMIAFPLFCGFLLDFALMPLFENANFASRLAFTIAKPWTSGFVHWFVGTCYMFHFALFVSMCRRILRTGVLYFIRDPDDPTFHPVRDVLERNVITQLRKIAFSAIVYGALIIVCLGGIVWGLWAASDQILPIHWSSTGSNIEFPLDILFYNFLTPFVVHYAKPSAGLTLMYGWWFRTVARALRLSDFLFRDRRFDEEGHWERKSWKAWLTRQKNHDLREEVFRATELKAIAKTDQSVHDSVRFIPDGRYVRAPASDQVRIPKGGPVFVPVDAENKRLDGKPDDEGVHASSSTMVTKVYVPPWFRVRICGFVIAVWLFAAFTGLCVTILPLLFGRYLLTSTLGPKEFINDIYAFSLGIYLLGGVLYGGIRRKDIVKWTRNTLVPADGGRQLLSTVWSGTKRLGSVIYVYTAVAIYLPLINAVLLEMYILMPMHYFFDASEHHVIHIVQDWTLGILYVRIGMRTFLFDGESRAARAMRQVFAGRYLNPDVRRATRFFILPATIAFALLLGIPFVAAIVVNKTYMRNVEDNEKMAVTRMAYPIASALVIIALLGRKLAQATGRWRARIRDEVYLVGERLHNFGEKTNRRPEKGKEKAKTKDGETIAS